MAESAGTIYAEIQIRLNKLESGLRAANSKLDAFSAKSKQRSTGFEKAWSAAFTAIGFLGAQAITKLLNGIKQGASVFAGFQQSIANTLSVTKAFGEEQRLIEKAAKEAGETTRFSARQAADALYFLASAGLDARQSIDALDGVLQLAGATQSDLASTASTVTAVLSQFNLQAAEAERVSNVFAAAIGNSQANMEKLTNAFRQVGPVAAGLGLSLEETTGALQLLFNAGFQGQQAGRALKSALADLASPTSNIEKIFKKLNISLKNVNPTTNDFASIIEELAKSGATTSDIIDAFGKIAGPQIAVLVKQGSDAIRDYTDAVTGTNAAAEAYAIQNDTLAGSVDIMKSKFESTAIAIFSKMEPGLRKLIDSVVDFLDATRPLTEMLGMVFNALFKIVSIAAEPVISFFRSISEAIGTIDVNTREASEGLDRVTASIKRAGELENTANKLNKLTDEYEALKAKTDLTEAEQDRLKAVIIEINKIMPDAITKFDEYGNAIEVSGEKSREAARQMLLAREAELNKSLAQLKVSETLYKSTIRQNEALAKSAKESRNRLIAQAANANARLALLEEFELTFTRQQEELKYGESLVDAYNKTMGELDTRLKKVGLSFKSQVGDMFDVETEIAKVRKEFEKAQKTYDDYTKAISKKTKAEILTEEAEEGLKKIADLENQIKNIQGEIEDLDKIEPVKKETLPVIEETRDIFKELREEYEKATREARTFGDKQDILVARLNFLKDAYIRLWEEGIDPTSEEMLKLKQLYDDTKIALDEYIQKQKDAIKVSEEQAKAIKLVEDRIAELQKKQRDRRAAKEFQENMELSFEAVLESAIDLVSGLIGLFNELTQARLLDLDEQLQAELEAAGVAEETNLERIERELEAARKAGDQEKIDELEKEKKKEQIILDFEKKKAEAEYQGALFTWSIALLNATAKLYEAIMVATAAAPWPANLPAILFATAAGANVVGVAAQKPKPPSFQFGGIVPGSNYSGDNVPVNANSGEMFLTRQNQADLLSFIRNLSAGGMQAGSQTIIVQSVLDGDIVAQSTVNRLNDGHFSLDPDKVLI